MRRFASIAVTGILLSGCLLLVGCQGSMPPDAGQPDPLSADAYPQITALEGLGKYLAFAPPSVKAGGGRPMSVSVPVRARTDKELNTQYRFEFFDQDGRPIEPVMGWRYLRLPARVQHFMQGAVLDDTAVDWRLQVRPAR